MDKILFERAAREMCERDAEAVINVCFGYVIDERSLDELGARLKGIFREHRDRIALEVKPSESDILGSAV